MHVVHIHELISVHIRRTHATVATVAAKTMAGGGAAYVAAVHLLISSTRFLCVCGFSHCFILVSLFNFFSFSFFGFSPLLTTYSLSVSLSLSHTHRRTHDGNDFCCFFLSPVELSTSIVNGRDERSLISTRETV